MERIEMTEESLEMVTGGSIVISPDLKTCGHNCNNQYNILNYNQMANYYAANRKKMSEAQMLKDMEANGWISKI